MSAGPQMGRPSRLRAVRIGGSMALARGVSRRRALVRRSMFAAMAGGSSPASDAGVVERVARWWWFARINVRCVVLDVIDRAKGRV